MPPQRAFRRWWQMPNTQIDRQTDSRWPQKPQRRSIGDHMTVVMSTKHQQTATAAAAAVVLLLLVLSNVGGH